MVDTSDPLPQIPRRRLRTFLVPPPEPRLRTPNGHDACRDCEATTVPCWLCSDEEGVPRPVPMTDQVREVEHVGICEHHGVVQAHCPGSSGHITRPAPAQPAIEPTPAQSKIAALGVLVGFILGVTIGVFLVAPAILRSLS